jgi:hypothetical protein
VAASKRIDITIVDSKWPRLTMIITTDGRPREVIQDYGIAASQFEPAVRDTLRLAVEAIIKSHKKETSE